MRKPNKFIVGMVGLAMLIAIGIYLNRRHREPASQTRGLPGIEVESTNRSIPHAQRPSVATQTSEEIGQTGAPKIPREKVEEYLRRHHRDAASLLAAFHALQDTNYLKEAATNFPNDPHLQWTILARDAFPEDKRKWLDAFKTSSPGNSLANYLSAQDYFKNHQPEAAMKEVAAASGKSQFADYSMETILDAEDLYRFNGASPAEIHTGAMSTISDDLHQLSQFKDLARGLQELQHQYASSGDSASVEVLAQMGVDFANRIATGDNGKFIINKLVGNASQAIVLESLDQNKSYDFLGGETPAQRLAEVKQDRTSFQDLSKAFESAASVARDDQMNAYWERMKIYGGAPAMRWLVQQTAATPNSGN
jgi:hypothetical protein